MRNGYEVGGCVISLRGMRCGGTRSCGISDASSEGPFCSTPTLVVVFPA